ncbi:MAG: c-type cytochrome [Acidimicrobiales bacterium]|nr:c-type cytochrome [Acidimicrobiales bacterium]
MSTITTGPDTAPSAAAGPVVSRRRARRATRVWLLAAGTLAAGSIVAACGGGAPATVAPTSTTAVRSVEEIERQGGAATVFNEGAGAFEQPVPGMDSQQRRTFAVGNSLFNQNWVTAPASTTGRDGLGPIFNAQSCSSCHFRDGRGRPPESADDPERGLLVRISVAGDDGAEPHPVYGDQFQDRALRDQTAEGSVVITTTERPGRFADGTAYSLAVPDYALITADGTDISGSLMVSPRVAPQVIGVGLIEAIPEEDVIAAEDPDDADGDGVSGRAHMVTDPRTGETVLGRFGWKAAVPTVEAQNAAAFVGDLGITSSLHPDQPCTAVQTECLAAPSGGEPEIEDDELAQVTFYTRTLAVPARRDVRADDVVAGEKLFSEIGCAACHTPTQRSGPSDIEALHEQTFSPFTDLLLHDMGPDLADGRPDGDASGREWRTPPLWGIGLVERVNDHTRYLHDGRARSLSEAVLWHGGEASTAQGRFTRLLAAERRALLVFLESL